MSKSALIQRTFTGGVAVDKKLGQENAFSESQGIDHRKKASSFELRRKFVKESGTTVTTPVYDGVRSPDSSVFFMGDTQIYRRTVDTVGGAGNWTMYQGSLVNCKSAVLNRDRQRIYVPTDKGVSAINYANSNTWMPDLAAQLIDQQVTNASSTNAYTLPNTIVETAGNFFSFKPDIEPLIKIGFYVIAKGTGNVIVTVHDAANTLIGQTTVLNANLTAGALNYATFSSQIRMSAYPNPYTYHVHLTTNTGTTTVRTLTSNDLSTADYQTYSDALVSGVYHPAGAFLQYIVIGNANYVAAWEPITDAPTKTEYQPHRLKLPSEYTVLGFAEYKEYYAVSAYKSVSSDYGGDFGANSTEGLIGFWDGASKGFAWFVKIESGAMESMYVRNGFIYGYINGVLHVTSGDIPVPVYEMQGYSDFTSTQGHDDDVYLQAPYKGMTVRDNLMMMAYPMLTANESMTPGVYSFGSKTKDFADSIAFDYIPSHAQTVSQFTSGVPQSGITYIGTFGKNTFMAWKTKISGIVTYGIDVLNTTNPHYDVGYMTSLQIDNKLTYRRKTANFIVITYSALPTGATQNASLKPYYLLEGSTTRQYGASDGSDTTNDTENLQIKLAIGGDYRTIAYGVELRPAIAATGKTSTPIVTSMTIVVDKNEEEGL